MKFNEDGSLYVPEAKVKKPESKSKPKYIRSRKGKLSDTEVYDICIMHMKDKTINEISKLYSVVPQTIISILKEDTYTNSIRPSEFVHKGRKKIPDKIIYQMCLMHMKGKNAKDVASLLGMNRETVRAILMNKSRINVSRPPSYKYKGLKKGHRSDLENGNKP